MKISVFSGLLMACLVGACSAATEGPASGESTGEDGTELGNKTFCGGIAGFACPSGYTCVDDPSDSCDPKKGGADCGGYCKRAPKNKSGCKNDPTKTYVATSAEECAVIRFYCAEGTPFFDSCGCGCQTGVAGTPCNQVTCGAGEFCCNESCSICVPEGGFCTEQFCSTN